MEKIGWYPGHMRKAQRQIEEKLSLVDFVVELLDARAPISTRNPLFDQILKNKKRVFVLTKSDMADARVTSKHLEKLEKKGKIFSVNIKEASSFHKLLKNLESVTVKEGQKRFLVVGVPNVGKSTFINAFVGKRAAKVGNTVGVTRQLQWYKKEGKNSSLELLDTPGISMPRFEDPRTGYHMALIGSLRLDVLPREEIVSYFLEFLIKYYPKSLETRYGWQWEEVFDKVLFLDHIAKKYGRTKGGEVDYSSVYEIVIRDFQQGKLGSITLDQLDMML